jgi:hypothetical protein
MFHHISLARKLGISRSKRASAKAQQLEPPDTNAHRLSRPFPIPFFIDVYFFSIVQPIAGPPGETPSTPSATREPFFQRGPAQNCPAQNDEK